MLPETWWSLLALCILLVLSIDHPMDSDKHYNSTAMPFTAKDLLKLILQECKDWNLGDPMATLELWADEPFYVLTPGLKLNPKFFPDQEYTALDLIQVAWHIKPGQNYPIGKHTIKIAPRKSTSNAIPLDGILYCMHNYPFRSEYNVDIDATADMLLTGPPKDVNSQYFMLRRTCLLHAPHLFTDDSPLLLLVLCLQRPSTVEDLLKLVGLVFKDDVATVTAKLLAELEKQYGGMGFARAFEELCRTMEGRWSEGDSAGMQGLSG